MKYLTIKKRTNTRKDGKPSAVAFYVEKNRKYGKVLSEKVISNRRPVLVTGANAAGKTRWLNRLHEASAMVWASRSEAMPLYLAADRPLSAWTDTKPLALWWASRPNDEDDRHWMKLKAWERVDALHLYLEETGAVLFVDDAHLVTGRKLKVLERCIQSSAVFVMSASEETRLAQTLRRDVLYRDPQIFRLQTEVAYDATTLILWVLIAAAIVTQAWALAAVLGGLKVLGTGKRATKQT